MYKLIMPVRRIPIGSTVTRITGVKKYRLLRTIKVNGRPLVTSSDGAAFLQDEMADAGAYTTVSGGAELLWHISGGDLLTILEDDGHWDGI